jgi:hypothetical protein
VKAYSRRTTHRFGHLLVAPQGLYSQPDGLELCAHLVELLNVSPGPDEVLSHNFTGILRRSSSRGRCGLSV